MSDDIWILGIKMTKFGKHPDKDVVDLASEAAMAALQGRAPRAAACSSVALGAPTRANSAATKNALATSSVRMMSATVTPIFTRPPQANRYSGRFSINRATASPRFSPTDCAQRA